MSDSSRQEGARGPGWGNEEPTRFTAWPAVAAGAVVWALLIPRMIPTAVDHGIFLSVAERLTAGDRLYAEVWDNKEPLFYYILTIGRWITPYASLLIEVLWMALAVSAVALVGRWAGQRPEHYLLAALAMTPIVLTGSAYLAGYTHLPGVALSLAVLASALHRRRVVTGLLLTTLTFTKLVMLPFGVLFLLLACRNRSRRDWPVTESAVYLGSTLLFLASVAWRGELGAFVSVQADNVLYAQGPVGGSGLTGFIEHVRAVVGPGEVTTILMVVLTLVVARMWLAARPADVHAGMRLVWAACAAALAFGVISTMIIGLWGHHGQVFYVCAALGGLLVTALLGSTGGVERPFAAVLTALVAAALLAGAPTVNLETYLKDMTGGRANLARLAAVSDGARAVELTGLQGSYARLGSGETPPGHAFGLDGWDLECRRFHQYWFQSAQVFDEVLECVGAADVIVVESVSEDFQYLPDWPAWNAFLAESRRLLDSDFVCAGHPWGELCVRATPD